MPTDEIRLELETVDQLFQDPSFDPFTPGSPALTRCSTRCASSQGASKQTCAGW
jgi:hypothetical protein